MRTALQGREATGQAGGARGSTETGPGVACGAPWRNEGFAGVLY